MTEDILKRIDAIAAKLGVAADQIWQITLYQARVEAFSVGILIVISLGLLFVAYRAFWWLNAGRLDTGLFDRDVYFIGQSLLVIGGAAVVCVIADQICTLATLLCNPQYWALHHLIG